MSKNNILLELKLEKATGIPIPIDDKKPGAPPSDAVKHRKLYVYLFDSRNKKPLSNTCRV